MRHARSVSLRGVFTGCLGVACLTFQTGCTRNYYYGSPGSGVYNPCAPGSTVVVPGAVQTGSMCDVPASSAVTAADSPDIVTRAKPPKVVVSAPTGSSTSGFPWRAADPDSSQITTKVEGGADSPVTR